MKIIVYGAGGKMGKMLIETIRQSSDEILCGVDKFAVGEYDFPIYASCSQITGDADCIIDFSVRAAIYDYLPYAVEHKIPCVIATTGYDAEENAFIAQAAETIPIFKTGNMSNGINLLLRLAKIAAAYLGNEANIEIIEQHHNQKVDAPSGTALLLANGIKTVLADAEFNYGRCGHTGKRPDNEIGIHAVRGGSVVGKHEILFMMNNEVVSIKHEAENKGIFAQGSLKAARFLIGKPNGIYTMENIPN